MVGVNKVISYKRYVKGDGKNVKCSNCNGNGYFSSTHGPFMRKVMCDSCHGKGYIENKKLINETEEIEIPSSIYKGQMLILSGGGSYFSISGEDRYGDLIIIIDVEESEYEMINNYSLTSEIKVNYPTLILGGKVEFKAIDDTVLNVFIKPKTEIGKKEYGVFIRDMTSIDRYLTTKFESRTANIDADVKEKIQKGLFLDLALHNNGDAETDLLSLGATWSDKIVCVDNSSNDIEIDSTDLASILGVDEVVVFYCREFDTGGNVFTVTDSDGNVFTCDGDNQGVVVYSLDGTDSYIADSVFTPLGVAQENPKIMSEKGDDFRDSFGNIMVLDENWTGETIVVNVTKDNWDYIDGIKLTDVDFALYEHTSSGTFNSNNMLIADTSKDVGFPTS